MTFKIEFGAEPRRSVVQVYFEERHFTLAYYNDSFDLHVGDIVYVEGKQEGLRGRVSEVNYNFKIKISDYKRVIAVVDRSVSGEFFMAGSHFVSFDRQALPYRKILAFFKAPEEEYDDFISGSDGSSFSLGNLSDLNVPDAISERGYEYYVENRVLFICIDAGKGRAIVEGRDIYEVEFEFSGGQIKSLTCSCFCSNICKHEFAVMLQLKETLGMIEKNYSGAFEKSDYFSAIRKSVLFNFAIDGKKSGSFTLGQ
jgi:hypothetical protein